MDYPNNIAEKILFEGYREGTDRISMACLSSILAEEFCLTAREKSILFDALWKEVKIPYDCYAAIPALLIILPQEDLYDLVHELIS
jgi:hypothetical protein